MSAIKRLTFSVLSFCCFLACSDKGSGPQGEPYYKLLYSYVDPDYSVLTFNSDSYEVIDSTPLLGFADVAFSPDGEYTYFTRTPFDSLHRATWVTHSDSGDTVAISVGFGGFWLEASTDQKYLLTSVPELTLFSLPNLNVIYEAHRRALGLLHPSKRIVYHYSAHDDTLYVVDFSGAAPVESKVRLVDPNGYGIVTVNLAMTPDGSLLIASEGGYLWFISPDSFKVLDYRVVGPFPDGYQEMTWHPDGQRLFMLVYGDRFWPRSGLIQVFDLRTKEVTLFADETSAELPNDFFPYRIAFTPDGNRTFIATTFFQTGALLEFDVESKGLMHSFEKRLSGQSIGLGLNPKAMYERSERWNRSL